MSTHDSDLEKQQVQHVDKVGGRVANEYEAETANARDDAHRDIDHGFDPAFIRHTRRKVDWRVGSTGCLTDVKLIPALGAIYSISLIDRNNLSFARAANNLQMMTDLGMTSGNNGYGKLVIAIANSRNCFTRLLHSIHSVRSPLSDGYAQVRRSSLAGKCGRRMGNRDHRDGLCEEPPRPRWTSSNAGCL